MKTQSVRTLQEHNPSNDTVLEKTITWEQVMTNISFIEARIDHVCGKSKKVADALAPRLAVLYGLLQSRGDGSYYVFAKEDIDEKGQSNASTLLMWSAVAHTNATLVIRYKESCGIGGCGTDNSLFGFIVNSDDALVSICDTYWYPAPYIQISVGHTFCFKNMDKCAHNLGTIAHSLNNALEDAISNGGLIPRVNKEDCMQEIAHILSVAYAPRFTIKDVDGILSETP
jgi:hypothetical protein